ELDLLAVAEAVVEDGSGASRLRLARLEAAPVADDLVEVVLAVVVVAGTVLRDGLLPRLRRLDVLPAIRVLLAQVIAGPGAFGALAAPGYSLIDLEPVELVGDGEALDAGGQAGDGLGVFEGMQGEGAGLAIAVVALVAPTEVRHGLDAELA